MLYTFNVWMHRYVSIHLLTDIWIFPPVFCYHLKFLWTFLLCGNSQRSLLGLVIHRTQHQFSSVTQSCLTLCNPMDCSTPGFPVHHQFLELAQTHVHQVGDAIQPSHPLLSPSPPAFNLFQHQGLFHRVSSLHQVAKYWGFSFSISPSNEYSGLIYFRINWFDLPAVQGTLKSLLQHHSSKASVLWHSAFFIVQLSHPYLTTGKTIPFSRWTFVGKELSIDL